MQYQNEIMQEIRKQRGQQYGSFEQNMLLINFIETYFMSNILLSQSLYLYGEFMKSIKNSHKCLIDETFDFTSKMMALKAVRSLNAKGDSYNDCIIDFLNYKNLACETLYKMDYFKNKCLFSFDNKVFNGDLNFNNYNLPLKWLLDKDKVFYYYDIFKNKFKYYSEDFKEFLKGAKK